MAANGIMFKSGAEPSIALLAMRRLFSSTSVLLLPMPRRSANAAPPDPLPTCWLEPVLSWTALREFMICSTVVTPCARRSSIFKMVTGTAVSASTRLIAEPVISIR